MKLQDIKLNNLMLIIDIRVLSSSSIHELEDSQKCRNLDL